METISELMSYLILLVNLAAGTRIIFCGISIMCNPDDKDTYILRIKNVLKAVILVNSVIGTQVILIQYFI